MLDISTYSELMSDGRTGLFCAAFFKVDISTYSPTSDSRGWGCGCMTFVNAVCEGVLVATRPVLFRSLVVTEEDLAAK